MSVSSAMAHISKGLEARKNGQLPDLAALRGSPQSVSALMQLRAHAEQLAVAHAGLAAGIEETLAPIHAEIVARYHRIRSLSHEQRNAEVHKETSEQRKRLIAINAEIRTRLAQEIAEDFRLMSKVAEDFQSPVSFLMTSTLGDARRDLLSRQLANAGVSELTAAARRAIATSDRAMAAAICSRMDALGVEGSRGIGTSKTQLAEVTCGVEVAIALASIEAVGILHEESVSVEHGLAGYAVNSSVAINLAMRRQELKRVEDRIAALTPKPPTTTTDPNEFKYSLKPDPVETPPEPDNEEDFAFAAFYKALSAEGGNAEAACQASEAAHQEWQAAHPPGAL